eukprot:SAG11_NODE_15913_length_563_cov_0.545259_1_plen_66_part_10
MLSALCGISVPKAEILCATLKQVPYYADPTQPGCSDSSADGVTCSDQSVERCSSAIDLTITTIDTH